MHTNTTGGPTDRPVLHRRPEDTADQPTTEPSLFDLLPDPVPVGYVVDLRSAEERDRGELRGRWGYTGNRWWEDAIGSGCSDLALNRKWGYAPENLTHEMPGAPAPQPAADTERDERLRGIQERSVGITLGPWFHEPRGGQNQNGDFSGMCIYDGHGEYLVHDVSDTDGAFIASAPTDVAWLLDEITRLDAVVTAVREVHAREDDIAAGAICQHCIVFWPCATVRALDGGAS